jgi:monooxygenase
MTIEHFDVVVVGAGLSGVAAGHHLRTRCPDRSFVILEGRQAIGGTWDLFRYPGVRSDSDMQTLGYGFRPWEAPQAIVEGGAILRYIRETASEERLEPHLRLGHKVVSAAWSSAEARWTVEAVHAGVPVRFTCAFLFLCGGYYDYDQGHDPAFPGREAYRGLVVHPQRWPQGLKMAGRQVAVIGSGATAVTLAPALAQAGAKVTLVQRSPSYVISRPSRDRNDDKLRRLLPGDLAHRAIRWKNLLTSLWFFRLSRRKPALVRRQIQQMIRRRLGPNYDVATHFSPPYDPWDQRLCVAADGDLFKAIKAGAVTMVTEAVEGFTADGLRLSSGAELAADVVVTATGLKLKALNGIELSVDGAPLNPAQMLTYKGVMFAGVPNLAAAFGYVNASWTLKCELACAYVCRILNRMSRSGARQATPRPPRRPGRTAPWLDFSSGYVRRGIEAFPKQAARSPWRLHQNYLRDLLELRWSPLADGVLRFSNPAPGQGERDAHPVS